MAGSAAVRPIAATAEQSDGRGSAGQDMEVEEPEYGAGGSAHPARQGEVERSESGAGGPAQHALQTRQESRLEYGADSPALQAGADD